MQDRYTGDIGDYGKFAMLRAMEDTTLHWESTGIVPRQLHLKYTRMALIRV